MLNKIYIKRFFKVVGFLLLGILAFIALKIAIFRMYTINNIEVNGESIVYERPKGMGSREPTKWDSISPMETKYTLVNNIDIFHDGKKIKGSVYEKDLRYYVNFKSYIDQIGGNLEKSGEKDILTYNGKSVQVYKDKGSYSKEYEALDFRGEILNIDDKQYVSINDIEGMLDLRDTWDSKKGEIHIFNDKKYVKRPSAGKSGKGALIRIEDIASGATLNSSTAKEKLKIVGDNLYSKGVKFHIAWVPRYKEPSKGIDNDLLKNKTIDNIQFINMLDHLIQKGGVIGLHGYTHQAGNATSLNGFELTGKLNSSEEETRKVIEGAIVTAKTLRIPIGFFESPHYGATRKQQRIIEEYFNILYEPYAGYYNANPLYSFRDKKRLYVPAIYGYVKDKHGEAMVKRIEIGGNFALKSLFVHPFMELGFVDLKDPDENGYRDYTYNETSPLSNIVKALDKAGYVTISVNSF